LPFSDETCAVALHGAAELSHEGRSGGTGGAPGGGLTYSVGGHRGMVTVVLHVRCLCLVLLCIVVLLFSGFISLCLFESSNLCLCVCACVIDSLIVTRLRM